MCGIFGWSVRNAGLGESQRAVVATALGIYNDTRGGDGWGTAYRTLTSVEISKGSGNIAPDSCHVANVDEVICHTRKATTGSVCLENAHPFRVGNIIGAHNGMLWNHRRLNKKYNRNYAVDSQHIFGHINSGLPGSDIDGYGAIEWWDVRDGIIRLCRLDDGELAIAEIFASNGEVVGAVWSSDREHLENAMSAAQISDAVICSPTTGAIIEVVDGVPTHTTDEFNLDQYSGHLFCDGHDTHGWEDCWDDEDMYGKDIRSKIYKMDEGDLEDLYVEREKRYGASGSTYSVHMCALCSEGIWNCTCPKERWNDWIRPLEEMVT